MPLNEDYLRYSGAKYAVSTGSRTSALQLSLLALDIKQGDRVVTTPASFVATANAALHVNAVPVFVDIEILSLKLGDDIGVHR